MLPQVSAELVGLFFLMAIIGLVRVAVSRREFALAQADLRPERVPGHAVVHSDSLLAEEELSI